MRFLVDTNVLSELRKKRRCHPNVARWAAATPAENLYTSVLVLGEIRQGIERARRHDPDQALVLDLWFRTVRSTFEGRILSIDDAAGEEWGRLNVPDPIPIIDGLLAATARVHGLTVATRNVGDLARTGVEVFDPFNAVTT